MPLTAGDMFICSRIGEEPMHESLPVQRRPTIPAVWLVLLFCDQCLYRKRRYCSEHNKANWWLTTMATVPDRPTRPRSAGRR